MASSYRRPGPRSGAHLRPFRPAGAAQRERCRGRLPCKGRLCALLRSGMGPGSGSGATPAFARAGCGDGPAIGSGQRPLVSRPGSIPSSPALFSLPRLRGRAGVGGRLSARRAFPGGHGWVPATFRDYGRKRSSRRPPPDVALMQQVPEIGIRRIADAAGDGQDGPAVQSRAALPEGIRNEESTSERRPHNGHYGKLLRLSKDGGGAVATPTPPRTAAAEGGPGIRPVTPPPPFQATSIRSRS